MAGLCLSSEQAIDAAAAKTMAQGSPGMVIAASRDGTPLFMRAYGKADLEHEVAMRPDAVFRLASLTKQFTAAVILSLAAEGKLSLDDPLSRHLPDWHHTPDVTLRQLLWQTSGIPDYAADEVGERTKSVAKSTDEMLAWIARLAATPDFAPGTAWAYSNSNYVLLGAVAERIAGKPLAELYEARLFAPAGMTATAVDRVADVVPHRVRGYRTAKDGTFRNADWIDPSIPGAAGALRGTAGDLLRWTEALYAGRILPKASVAMMIAPGRLADGRSNRFGMPVAWQEGLKSDYGMGVFVGASAYGPRLWHGGDIDGFNTWLGYYPDRGVTIALLQNSESADFDRDAIEAAVFRSVEGQCR